MYDFGRDGQVALSNNGNFVVQGLSDRIEVTNLNSGIIETINLLSANPYGNYEPVGISDDGQTVFITTWNSFLVDSGSGGIFSIDVNTNNITRVDVDSSGSTLTEQGWSKWSDDIDISSDGRFVTYADRDHVISGDWNSGQKVNIFVKDMLTGELDLIDEENIDIYGTYSPKISDDGRYVLFKSDAELTESDKSDREINPDYPWDNYEPLENDFFLADRLNNTIIRINEDKDGTRFDSGGYGTSGELSADGTKVVFDAVENITDNSSNSTNLKVFVKDLTNGNI